MLLKNEHHTGAPCGGCRRKALVLFCSAASAVLQVGEIRAESSARLFGGLVEATLAEQVNFVRSRGSYIFSAKGGKMAKASMSIRRVSRRGLVYGGDLYFHEYERIRKAGGRRIIGAASSGPSTGESLEIRYIIKPKFDRRHWHQVRAHYTKIGWSEWVEAILSVRSKSWNSAPSKTLRTSLRSITVTRPWLSSRD